MIKLIIFDWDDVFTLGSKEGYYQCYRNATRGVGIKLTRSKIWQGIIATWGKSFKVVLAEILKKHPELLEKAIKIYEKNLFGDTFVKNLKLTKGANELLKKLSKRYTLAVATGQNPILFNDRIVQMFKIPKVFSQIVFSQYIKDPEKQKPHPYALEKIMKNLKFKPSEAVFVGDAHNDVKMAQAAKVTPIVVLTGHLSKSAAEKLDVRYIIKDVTSIEKILREME